MSEFVSIFAAPLAARAAPLRMHRAIAFALIALFSLPTVSIASAAQADEPDVMRLWTGGMTPKRIDYEAAVIELALEKSAERYGPYKLVLDHSPHSGDRALRELRTGEHIQMASAPTWLINLQPDPPMTVVPVPLDWGLMGYRRLVVRRDDLERFTEIKTIAELQEQVAGLGSGWVDVDVFKQGGFKVTEGDTVEQLYTMLARERFDYLPLGSLEVEESLAASEHRDQLAIVPDLIIYYPLSIYVQVSREQPELAERLHYGLREARESGAIRTLFNQYYGSLIKELRALKPRIVELENPTLPEFEEHSGPELLPKAERLPSASD